ncbi:MAG: hypothetical protein ACI8QZ_004098 [Chlamydiales bacterium]|jgi:hypothetical protein
MTLRALSLSAVLAGCLPAPVVQAPAPTGALPAGIRGPLQVGAPAGPGVLLVSMLDNGTFDQRPPQFRDSDGLRRVPWWKSAAGAEQCVELKGRTCLRTAPGEWASQPVAAHAPLQQGLEVRGYVKGRGLLVLRDGAGREMRVAVGSDGAPQPDGFELFEVPFSTFAATLGADAEAPTPRYVLALRPDGTSTAHWSGIDVRVPLPDPGAAALRADLIRELDWIFGLWLEHAADDLGPRSTGFLAQRFDILTGAARERVPGAHNIFFDLLMRATRVHDEPRWDAAFDRFLTDFLELGFDPGTGLPRHWDVERDEPLDAYLEIAETLRFLLDVASDGPRAHRERALERARAIGQTVLERGVLPDGRVAVKYRAADARPNVDVIALRQLDLPAQLGRLGAIVGDERYRDAALHALGVLEYAHIWPGVWHSIDPGFDDQFGHYGARAAVLWRAWPDERSFRRLAYSGLGHYVPLWADALRLGGNVAADQVRCWAISLDVIDLEPSALEHLAPVLADAGRAHFKGQQYGNGAWGDVTHFGFDPQPHLQVGDLTGVPQNLLEGLALLHDAQLARAGGMPLDEVRARFCAVWESSREHYRRPFGYLATREQAAGDNLSFGSLRLAVGLVTMLERL